LSRAPPAKPGEGEKTLPPSPAELGESYPEVRLSQDRVPIELSPPSPSFAAGRGEKSFSGLLRRFRIITCRIVTYGTNTWCPQRHKPELQICRFQENEVRDHPFRLRQGDEPVDGRNVRGEIDMSRRILEKDCWQLVGRATEMLSNVFFSSSLAERPNK
jgi:hypothetical protein